MIDELIADLKRDEGWRSKPYKDHLGNWTWGWGFLIDARRNIELDPSVGAFWLERVAEKRWYELMDRFPWLADEDEDVQRALSNMAYQLGVNGVSNFKKMLAALKNGDRETAAVEALDSVWAKVQTPERARRVARLIRGHE